MHTYENNNLLPPLLHKIKVRIGSFCVKNKYIFLIIKPLDSSKSHGYDNVSIK